MSGSNNNWKNMSCTVCNKKLTSRHQFKYCSKKCSDLGQFRKQLINCKTCNKEFLKDISQLSESGNNFCSKSCAATYNNKIFKKRTRIQKFCSKCNKDITYETTNELGGRHQRNCCIECYPSIYCAPKLNRSTLKYIKLYMNTIRKRFNFEKIDIDYTHTQLFEHLQSFPQWEEIKDNYHIDHIFPVKAFTEHNIEDVKIICALDNLQPLSPKDNLSKGSRYSKNKFYEYLESKNIEFIKK